MASASNSESPHGILKKDHSCKLDRQKQQKFDEMNILATYHPADKDYGHMKIDEPKTPYRHDSDGEGVNPDTLTERLNEGQGQQIGSSRQRTISTDDEEDDQNLTQEARERKKKFQDARKNHYNMKEEMKRAKELLEKEMSELGDE